MIFSKLCFQLLQDVFEKIFCNLFLTEFNVIKVCKEFSLLKLIQEEILLNLRLEVFQTPWTNIHFISKPWKHWSLSIYLLKHFTLTPCNEVKNEKVWIFDLHDFHSFSGDITHFIFSTFLQKGKKKPSTISFHAKKEIKLKFCEIVSE